VTADLTFTDLYEWWEHEERLTTTGPVVPNKAAGWAGDLLSRLGFKLQTNDEPRNTDPWHQGDTIYLTPRHGLRDVRHELAHAIVWLAHGKAGGPQQWGIGSNPHPRARAVEQELLVQSVEWVLTDNYEENEQVKADAFKELCPTNYRRDSDPIIRPEIIVEAIRMVNEVLPGVRQ